MCWSTSTCLYIYWLFYIFASEKIIVLKCTYKNYLEIFGNIEFDYIFQPSKFILNIFYEVHNAFILFLYIFHLQNKILLEKKNIKKIHCSFSK